MNVCMPHINVCKFECMYVILVVFVSCWYTLMT